MEAERGELLSRAHPNIRNFVLSHGYEIRIMDPHWGAKDLVSDDHSLNPLLLSLINQTVDNGKAKMINFMVKET